MDAFGRSPLFEAVLANHKPLVMKIKDAGGKVIGTDQEIQTLLFRHVQNDNLEAIQLLFHSGLKQLNRFVNADNRNIAHMAVVFHRKEIIQFLIRFAHFDLGQKDAFGRTPAEDALIRNC